MNVKSIFRTCLASVIFSLPLFLGGQDLAFSTDVYRAGMHLRLALEQFGHDTSAMRIHLVKACNLDPSLFVANALLMQDASARGDSVMRDYYLGNLFMYQGNLTEDERLLVKLMQQLDRPSQAKPIGRQLVDRYPNDAALHLLYGYVLLQARDLPQARKIAKRAVLLKGIPACNRLLSLTTLADGDLGAAKSAYQSYQHSAPDHPAAWQALGDFYMTIHQYCEAVTAYGQAVKLKPGLEGLAIRLRQAEARLDRN